MPLTVNLAPVSTHRSKWVPLGDYIASNTDECTATLMYAVNLKQSGTVNFEYYYADSNIIFEFFVSRWPRGRVGGRDSPWLGCTCRNHKPSPAWEISTVVILWRELWAKGAEASRGEGI